MAAIPIKVPSVGESISEGILARWLKPDGSMVNANEPLFELESDKASQVVNAPSAGTLKIEGRSWIASWYGPDGRRVRRKVGLARTPGERDGLTKAQAEEALRKLRETEMPNRATGTERITMTEAGAALFESEWPPMAAMVQDLWQGFRESEKRMLVHLLAKLRLNLLSLEAMETASEGS